MLTKEQIDGIAVQPEAVAPMQVEDLYAKLMAGADLAILDVRNEDDFARWRVEGRADLKIVNVPYFEFLEDEEGSLARIPQAEELLVVCAREGSSEYVAQLLAEQGIRTCYLEGGILSWGNYYDVRDLVDAPWGRIVQVTRPARGDVSFLVISDGEAAVVDPLRHVDLYLSLVKAAGARLTHAFDTHGHADHISGGSALAQMTGARYFLHPYDAIHPLDMLPATLSYHPLQDGDRFVVGKVDVEVVWFPGHTLGQVNYLFTAPDGERYLFTGDGIFLKSFGRPDLGGRGEAWTPILYESLFERLPQRIDDATWILPSHFSLLDEADAAGRFTATYGALKQENDALRWRPLPEFKSWVLGSLPYFPPEYVEIKRVNAGLVQPSEEEASELELGKNICALSGE
jgi:glyoxylase-like metal-dependent hydrolase (beta-lactamase superfamily II)/rhodanese-related sulfurtransferase